MRNFEQLFYQSKPYLGVLLLQFGYAGMAIISKFALNQGMSQHVFVVYRHVVATLVIAPFAIIFDRKVRTKMTFSVFMKIVLLGFLEPVFDQNLYYSGMKYTTATFAIAMCNIIPAFAFIMAWACRLERVNILKLGSQAKVIGTIVTVGGAMAMTFIKGPSLNLPWTKDNHHSNSSSVIGNHQDLVKGSLMIAVGCIGWSAFITIQAITLKSYPTELSLTTLICLVGTIGGTLVALIMDRGNPAAWSLHFDSQLLAVVYGGIMCSGVTYYIQGVIMQKKGPVFISSFSPMSMILVAFMSSFILSEIMYLGRIIGAVVIITGLYFVLWGKSKDQFVTKAISDKIAPSERQMNAMDEISKAQSSQEFLVLDVANKEGTN